MELVVNESSFLRRIRLAELASHYCEVERNLEGVLHHAGGLVCYNDSAN